MRKILLIGILGLVFNSTFADDDVYDAPRPKKEKVRIEKKTAVQEEQVVPYYEEEQNKTVRKQSTYSNSSNNEYDRSYEDNYNSDNFSSFGNNNSNWYADDYWASSYSNRINRFHNPSMRFSTCCNANLWNNPYNNYSYNNFWNDGWYFNSFPSYSSFYGNNWSPFNTQVVIIQSPWLNSWYNTGWGYSTYSFWNWGTPSCSNFSYGNPYYNYQGNNIGYNYYGNENFNNNQHRSNTVNTPRTGGYNNTNSSTYNGSKGYGKTENVTPPSKPENTWAVQKNKPTPNQQNEKPNVYKYNNPSNSTNEWNTKAVEKSNSSNNQQPSNHSGWGTPNSNSNSGGVKFGSRPK